MSQDITSFTISTSLVFITRKEITGVSGGIYYEWIYMVKVILTEIYVLVGVIFMKFFMTK